MYWDLEKLEMYWVKEFKKILEIMKAHWEKDLAEEGIGAKPKEYKKDAKIKEYRINMVDRFQYLEGEFVVKAKKCCAHTIVLQKEIESVKTEIMGMVNEG